MTVFFITVGICLWLAVAVALVGRTITGFDNVDFEPLRAGINVIILISFIAGTASAISHYIFSGERLCLQGHQVRVETNFGELIWVCDSYEGPEKP